MKNTINKTTKTCQVIWRRIKAFLLLELIEKNCPHWFSCFSLRSLWSGDPWCAHVSLLPGLPPDSRQAHVSLVSRLPLGPQQHGRVRWWTCSVGECEAQNIYMWFTYTLKDIWWTCSMGQGEAQRNIYMCFTYTLKDIWWTCSMGQGEQRNINMWFTYTLNYMQCWDLFVHLFFYHFFPLI